MMHMLGHANGYWTYETVDMSDENDKLALSDVLVSSV